MTVANGCPSSPVFSGVISNRGNGTHAAHRPVDNDLSSLLERSGLNGTPWGDGLQLRSRDGSPIGETRQCGSVWWLYLDATGEWCAFMQARELVMRALRAVGALASAE